MSVYKVLQTEAYRKWFKRLKDIKAKFAIGQRLERIMRGNFGDSKSVGDGVFELRVSVGKGYRIYFKNNGKEIVILLVGGDKSTQDSDIKIAKKMAKEY
ncbi:MAG: type II toxin-antitoxin system RelE/ParE family toxin [Treponemataceae bacterium]|nr:type II toxin-antitoxin system RelE/ParE family toxin [Treponemataceae bacterium]